MAWIRAMGAPADDKKLTIYKDGVQYLSMESPGGYTYPGDAVTAASFLSDRISVVNGSNNVCIAGTVLPIDITDYAAVHIISKHNVGAVGLSVYVNDNKTTTGYNTRVNTGTDGTYHETVLNISSFTGNKYIFIATDQYSMNEDVKEIWLSKE